ncbi:hypothetical protein E2C01_036116 [Portunus trituberculatus]|uniref:Uncharacterized protein n=1 Tax=Portunus trituberculatus TaxID=210409 RepID=A0A5B7FDC2_PORTR|nr:hypothetical protein [Portunus trituberculatus]
MATRDISCKGCEFDYWEIIAPAMQVSVQSRRGPARTFIFLLRSPYLASFDSPPQNPRFPKIVGGKGGYVSPEQRGSSYPVKHLHEVPIDDQVLGPRGIFQHPHQTVTTQAPQDLHVQP